MIIRQLTDADAPALRALWNEGLRNHASAFLLTAEELAATPEERFRKNIATHLYVGAFKADKLVGFIVARQGGVERLRHTADIGPFYVADGARGHGTGSLLMEVALDTLSKLGLKQVELAVDEANVGAVAFYTVFQFEEFGRRPRSVIIDDVPRHELLMIRALDGANLRRPA